VAQLTAQEQQEIVRYLEAGKPFFYSQDSIAAAEATLKDKSSKIVVEKGQIVKVSKDAKGIVSAGGAYQELDRLD